MPPETCFPALLPISFGYKFQSVTGALLSVFSVCFSWNKYIFLLQEQSFFCNNIIFITKQCGVVLCSIELQMSKATGIWEYSSSNMCSIFTRSCLYVFRDEYLSLVNQTENGRLDADIIFEVLTDVSKFLDHALWACSYNL